MLMSYIVIYVMFCDALSSVACCMMQTMARLLRSHFGSRCAAYIMIYIVEGPLFQNFLSRMALLQGLKNSVELAPTHTHENFEVAVNETLHALASLGSWPESWHWPEMDPKGGPGGSQKSLEGPNFIFIKNPGCF